MDYEFDLVMRLEPDALDASKTVCAYMGAAEFEGGAVPAARKRLEASNSLVTAQAPINLDGVSRQVYYLGAAAHMGDKIQAMQAWVNAGMYSCAYTYFDLVFKGVDIWGDPVLPGHYRTIAWWSLCDDLVWSMDKERLAAFAAERNLRVTDIAAI